VVGEEIPQMQLPSSRVSIVPSGTSKEVAAVEVEMRLVWICCGILMLTGCGQETDYQPTANDLDKMSRMEAVNSQGDGVWDDTNYQWEIQDLRDGGARVAQDKSAEDLKAAKQLDTAPQKESPVDATETTDLNEQGSEQKPTSPESALPEKSEAAVKSISS
jgi:hypothetical protein